MKDTIKKPNPLLYYPLYWGYSLYYNCRNKVINSAKELSKVKGPALVLSTHPSAIDFYYAARAFYPKRLTVIANRYYTAVKPTAAILKPLHVIPKALFSKDIETVKRIISAAKKGHILLMMPEGRLSTDGKNFPMAEGTVELIKKLGIDVYVLNTKGAYYGRPKWAKEKRRGVYEITGKKILDAKVIKEMPIEQIAEIVNSNMMFQSDVIKGIKCKDRTKGLENILYICPECKSEFALNAENNKVSCSKCGFETYMDEYCRFVNGQFRNIQQWYEYQESVLESALEKTVLSTPVLIKCIKDKKMRPVGMGVCTLSTEGFIFRGEKDGQPFEIHLPLHNLEALPFSAGEEFELYYNGELHYFYPLENAKQCVKWSSFVDIYRRRLKEK